MIDAKTLKDHIESRKNAFNQEWDYITGSNFSITRKVELSKQLIVDYKKARRDIQKTYINDIEDYFTKNIDKIKDEINSYLPTVVTDSQYAIRVIQNLQDLNLDNHFIATVDVKIKLWEKQILKQSNELMSERISENICRIFSSRSLTYNTETVKCFLTYVSLKRRKQILSDMLLKENSVDPLKYYYDFGYDLETNLFEMKLVTFPERKQNV